MKKKLIIYFKEIWTSKNHDEEATVSPVKKKRKVSVNQDQEADRKSRNNLNDKWFLCFLSNSFLIY